MRRAHCTKLSLFASVRNLAAIANVCPTLKSRQSPLALAHFDAMKNSFDKKETELLKEVSEIDEELNGTKKKI